MDSFMSPRMSKRAVTHLKGHQRRQITLVTHHSESLSSQAAVLLKESVDRTPRSVGAGMMGLETRAANSTMPMSQETFT